MPSPTPISGATAPSADHSSSLRPSREAQFQYLVSSYAHYLRENPGILDGTPGPFTLTNYSEITLTPPSPAHLKSPTSSSASTITGEKQLPNLNDPIPSKAQPKPIRNLRHRVLIIYRRLFTLVTIGNLAAITCIFALRLGTSKPVLETITAANLTLAVVIRQDYVINSLFAIFCSVPHWMPLWVRHRAADVYHLGGVHSSAGICAGLWLLATCITSVVCGSYPNDADVCTYTWTEHAKGFVLVDMVLSWMLIALFLVMVVFAYPTIRRDHHNLFEVTHRFAGWTMLAIFWAKITLSVEAVRRDDTAASPFTYHAVRTPSFWMIIISTLSICISWLFLRKVKVEAEPLSDHAVRLHFPYDVPVNGTFTRLSTRPLLEWHSFGAISAPPQTTHPASETPGRHSVIISSAGDWTRHMIANPPTSIYVRGRPVRGVLHCAKLFRRVLIVATGSGIAPCIGPLLQPASPTQLVWSTPNPDKTFGKEFVTQLRAAVPGAVIWNTRERGRPDLVAVSFNEVRRFGAEAVVIIANEGITKKVVYGLRARGVVAMGAIWDSWAGGGGIYLSLGCWFLKGGVQLDWLFLIYFL